VSKQARNRAREARIAQELAQRRARRRNGLLASGGGVVILGLLVAIVISLVNAAGKAGADNTAASPKQLVNPAAATATGALLVGRADAPVKLEVFLDYMCPFCGRFERANGDEIVRLVADGTVQLHLYPLSFLDRTSNGTRHSTRAANAVATVADRAPDKVLGFNNALFARQPAEGSPGLSNDDMAALAADSGVPPEVIGLFPAETFQPWIAKYTDAAFQSGVTGTPTVKINGVVFKGDLYTVGPLTQALIAAKGR
jgi:protein-disulfide isomerase